MTNDKPGHHLYARIFSRRRLVLLTSVAGIAAIVALGGPTGYTHLSLPWMSSARAADAQSQHSAGFADLVAKVKPAVISVRVEMDETSDASDLSSDKEENSPSGPPFEKFFQQHGSDEAPGGMPQRHELIIGAGSGFFISPDGYAVTNDHVVDHARSVQVTTDDGATYKAKVIGTDPKTDLALIKVDGKSSFAYVNFEDHAPRVGDWVVAVGNPFGLGGTVTAGIVSAQGRDIGSGPYDNYIQIDAPINKGNSGGPAFDINGNVIGVNTAIYSPSGGSIGIGFDVPAQTAKAVIAELKDKGVVTRGWLGVQVQPVTTGIADSLGMKKVEGAMVDEPQNGSPAAKAGVHSGDVVTALNGTPIKDSRDLSRKVAALAPGSSVKLDILRNGESKTLTVTLGELPNRKQADAGNREARPDSRSPHIGLRLAPATEVAGSGGKGVVVTGVDPEGSAAEHGFQSGDVIVDVGGKAVGDASDVRNALSEAKSQGKHAVLMRVKTADTMKFVALPIG
ncbi:Do family serine endopeptidase [Bradyrhizobium valentinum]|uniref:Probable periplasmic serine endoprotease DegP-like n=1 Tax=Bradyrhizobium valentinum TaxID=1518501 RepID=A0A0R3KTX1_9BRAD|nr:Do family serine endopeptidase [Bradyrhizobium valentinum]KRQ96868.1 serine peptidase [Bradyrhizobium valentinum]